jgi:alkylated DNA repair dioxygenase AlkB
MKPLYYDKFIFGMMSVDILWNQIPWVRFGPRNECWMNDFGLDYTYGTENTGRTYSANPMSPFVKSVLETVNILCESDLDVCFINGYQDARDGLGWHSDDSPEVSNDHPIAVVSFGAEREIWWRKIGEKGEVPPENRQLLANRSLFIMPAGFQTWGQHRIPKHPEECGPRISLTFRKFKHV